MGTVPAEVRDGLGEASQVSLVSLYPHRGVRETFGGVHMGPAPLLYEHPVLGSGVVTRAEQLELLSALQVSVATKVPFIGIGCFSPRHALVYRHGGHQYEILVCFQCEKSQVYRDGQKVGSWFDHSGRGAATFNAVLERHGIPLSPD